MKQTSGPAKKTPADGVLKDIRRATRRQFSAEEKIRVVLEGLRGEESIAEPVLLGCERPPFSMTNFCHRRLVAEWFEREVGVEVPEVGQEPQPLREALGFNPWFSTEAFYIDENGWPTDAGLFDDD
jgi:hypothetical protein